jgi:signal transduction histidine kinase
MITLLCHDIANPLTAIKAGIEIMRENKIMTEERKSEINGRIDRSIGSVIGIIANVRKMQQAETGKLDTASVPLLLSKCIEEALSLVQTQANAKGIRFQLENEFSSGIEPSAAGDHLTITYNIIANILTNGIKFSKPNSLIQVRLLDAGFFIEIKVQDWGIGIPPGVLPNIFNKNIATTRLGTAGEAGSGFGLPIAKILMDNLDGSIEVVSQVSCPNSLDSGTIFTLKFRKYKASSLKGAA